MVNGVFWTKTISPGFWTYCPASDGDKGKSCFGGNPPRIPITEAPKKQYKYQGLDKKTSGRLNS